MTSHLCSPDMFRRQTNSRGCNMEHADHLQADEKYTPSHTKISKSLTVIDADSNCLTQQYDIVNLRQVKV